MHLKSASLPWTSKRSVAMGTPPIIAPRSGLNLLPSPSPAKRRPGGTDAMSRVRTVLDDERVEGCRGQAPE